MESSTGEENAPASGSCVLKLKGLPYSTTEQDVYNFFHGFRMRRVAFVLEADGRPSGLAFAEFECAQDALTAMRKNGEYIGDRYVKLLHVPKQEMEEQVKFGTAAIPKPIRPQGPGSFQSGFVGGQFAGMPQAIGMGGIGDPLGQAGGGLGWGAAGGVAMPHGHGLGPHFPLASGGEPGGGRGGGPGPGFVRNDGSTIRIRGLPFRATEQEIVEFFDGYDVIGDSVHIGMDSSGRPSGEGWVTFQNQEAAKRAVREKNRQYLHHRYLELSPVQPQGGSDPKVPFEG